MEQKRPLTFSLFLLRLLSGLVGGTAGTLAVFVIYFVMLNLVPQTEGSALSIFVTIIMAFVGTLTANTLVGVMVSFLDNEKYSRRKTTIMHIFLFNFILFFLTIPLYMMGVALDIVNEVAAMHFLLSAFISALIMEVLAGYEYSLLGIYSSALGIFVSMGIAIALITSGVSSITIMFAAMPGVWLVLQIVGGLSELIYDNFVHLYGIEALNVRTDLGGDTEVETEEDEEDDEEDDDEDDDEEEKEN